jgi:hypothetical protein
MRMREPIPLAVGVVMEPFDCWDCGFEYHRGHGCSSVVLVAASATSRSLVRSSPTPRVCLIVCDTETSTMRRSGRESGSSGAGKIDDVKSNELAGNVVPYALA